MMHKVYKLEGSALDAAKRIHMARITMAKLFGPKIVLPMTFSEISSLSQKFHAEAYAKMRTEIPELLERTGLATPVIVIKQEAGTLPRAYREYPSIYTNGGENDGIYLYAPIAHDGSWFVPPDSRLLDYKESDAVGNALFAGGWSDPLTIMPLAMEGTELPRGFVPPTDMGEPRFPARIFLPQGASYNDLNDHLAKRAAWNDHMSRLADAVRDAMLVSAHASFDPSVVGGDGFYVNMSYAIQAGAPQITASLRRDDKGGDFMKAGQPLPLPDSADYVAAPFTHGEYRITPNANPTTDFGRTIAALFGNVPPFADVADYPSLATPDGRGPIHHNYGGIDFLYYSGLTANDPFVPAGAKPVSNATYWWIRNDEEDRNRGIVPPPMPASVVAELMRLKLAVPQGTAVEHRPKVS
ncbi:MAG: hypothetical protein EBQ96_04075 [Proteobacteria bacterium]|nr:hypothetical protein [Pseudomonadota bacterium]